LFVQTELFPYLPTAFERRLLSRGIPCVYDYDDAWFHRYDGHANRVLRVLLRNKIPSLIERAAGVIVGSTYLAQYMRPFNRNVNLIPTCIDLECYPSAPLPLRPDPFFTIGWIGSPSTTLFLREVEGALAQFCSRHEARIVLIGASQEPLHIPNLTRLPWTEETEVEAISQFDVGIMPLSDTPFNRGKCAFKLIQYMGCWKPVIASPVGENVRVVEHGSNGFLAASPSEWMDALERLYADSALRQTMGRVGRGKIEREYSLQVMAPRVAEILRCVVQAQRR
jgi:glycosyltransferase involved in cell wall biosynthesis